VLSTVKTCLLFSSWLASFASSSVSRSWVSLKIGESIFSEGGIFSEVEEENSGGVTASSSLDNTESEGGWKQHILAVMHWESGLCVFILF
jgi:hypothetical protein